MVPSYEASTTCPSSGPSGDYPNEPTGEGVCYWLTRLNRHFGDVSHLLIAPSKWGTQIPATGECVFGGELLAGEVRTSSVVHRQRLCVPFAIRQVRLAPRIASR
jgi:hypothetical protein